MDERMDELMKVKLDLKMLIEYLRQNHIFLPPELDLNGAEKGLLAWLYNLIFGH